MNRAKQQDQRPRLIRRLFRRSKRRAPSFDATVTSNGSCSDCLDSECQQNCCDLGGGDHNNAMARATTLLKENVSSNLGKQPEAQALVEESPTDRHPSAKPISSIQIVEADSDEEEDPYQDVALKSRLEALKLQEELFGAGHPDVLFALQNLGLVHFRRGEYQQAHRVFDEKRRLAAATMPSASGFSGPPREVCVPRLVSEQESR